MAIQTYGHIHVWSYAFMVIYLYSHIHLRSYTIMVMHLWPGTFMVKIFLANASRCLHLQRFGQQIQTHSLTKRICASAKLFNISVQL